MYSQRVIITQRGLFCNNVWLTFFYEYFLTWILLFYLFFIIILFVFNNIFDAFSFSFSFLVQIHSFRLHFSYENNPAPPTKAIKIDKKRHQWNYQFLSTPFHSCITTDLSTNNLCYLTLWSSAKKRRFGGTIGSFTENYIHSLVCLLYTITRSSPSAIVALTMTAHNPSFTLFVDPVPRNHSDLVHATGLLPLNVSLSGYWCLVLCSSLLQKVNGFWNRPFVCACGYRDMVAMIPSSSLFLSLFLVLCLNRVHMSAPGEEPPLTASAR